MVKNKEDKTKLSNWVNNDVFAIKIESEKFPEYNERYIILIQQIIMVTYLSAIVIQKKPKI